MTQWDRIIHNRKVQFTALCLLFIGIIPLLSKGLVFGLDFTGGTLIKVRLAQKLDASTMEVVTANIDERLNGLGLKDIRVRPWGEEFVVVEVAETDYGEIKQIESILQRKGKFEAIIEGVIAIGPDDILSVKTNPQEGYGTEGNSWRVPFFLKPAGATRFSAAAKGKCSGNVCSKVYMFIDRPENAVVLIPFRVWSQVDGDGEELMYMNPGSRNQLIDVSEVENSSISKFILMLGNEVDESTLTTLSEFYSQGWERAVVPDWLNGTEQISALGYEVVSQARGDYHYWIWAAAGLKSIAFLTSGLTDGSPHSELTVSGGAPTQKEAEEELRETAIILSAGKLPVSASVESTQTISPLLGKEFFTYSFISGILSMLGVGILIYIRYRRPSLVAPIMYTSISEILMILGVASLINWNIDLSGIAGIVAAVGTGVSDQILMTDEIMMGEISERIKHYGFGARIKRAFNIIFTSAAAVVFTMLPLIGLGMGLLRGFAITTIIGVLIGITITRPAYAEVINYLIE